MASFPRTAWAAATRAVLADLPHADLSYGDHRGHQRVREAFASYLARVRGMRATPELMAMTSGFSAGIARAGLHGRVEGVAAGMQAVVRLDDGVNDLELVEDLHDRGVEVVALSRYAIDSPARGLVIGFGQPTVPELRRATAIIADVIAGRG